MAHFVFNISLGRAYEFYRNVKNNSPANSAFVLVAINAGAATDGTMRDYATLAALLADADVAEVTNGGYARKVLTDAELAAVPAPDNTNNRVELSLPAFSFATVAAGTAWTDLVVCYRPDTASADADIVPMTLFDAVKTPDGGDIPFNAGPFWRGNAT